MATKNLPWILSLLIASQSACSAVAVASRTFKPWRRIRHHDGHCHNRGCRRSTMMMMMWADSACQQHCWSCGNNRKHQLLPSPSSLAFVNPSIICCGQSRALHHHRYGALNNRFYATTKTKSSTTTTSSLSMSLVPIPINILTSILPTPTNLTPTGDQYVTYLGRTPKQRYESLFEGASIAFLGSMFAYFVSFVVGQFLATCLGVIFLFWPILSPEFKAYQRNWELVGGRDLVDVWMDDEDDYYYWRGVPEDKRGLYGAYYVTKIQDVCVVDDVRAPSEEEYDLEEFSGYTMATDELESVTGLPWKLRLRLSDNEGRDMQVHSRLSEEYLDIQPGMDVVGVLLSTSKGFGELAGMTDFCVLDSEIEDVEEYGPEVVAWVGDYPYLDKDVFLRTLSENGVMDSLLDFDDDEGEDVEEGLKLKYDTGAEEEEESQEYINVK